MKKLLIAIALLAWSHVALAQGQRATRFETTAGGSVTAPVFTFQTEPALGIYRVSSGIIGVSGPLKIQTGSTLRSNTGAPTGGNDGDFYFRSDTGDIYRRISGTWTAIGGGGGGGTGTVTSVNVTLPASMFSVSGGPITTSGTIAGSFAPVAANLFFGGPVSGAATTPAYRRPALADLGQSGAASGQVPKWDGSAWTPADDAGASTGAPVAAQYITRVADATLINERVITAGTGINITDGGAGGSLTISATATGSGPVIGFSIGDGSIGTNVGPMLQAPSTGTVSTAYVVVKTSDPAVGLQFTIRQNGTAIFASAPTVAAGVASGYQTTFAVTGAPLAVTAASPGGPTGDVFTIDIVNGSASWQFSVQVR